MFPEKPMKPLTCEEWKEYNKVKKCHLIFVTNRLMSLNQRLEIIAITPANTSTEDQPTGTAI